MTSIATAIYVMIASPSDVKDARDTVYKSLSRWNEANTRERGVVLVPLRWETGTVPVLGNDAQSIINKQLVERADIVFALFGNRLGLATPDAISGTASEINLAVNDGKPVHLYFSTGPIPNEVDAEQLLALRRFRSELEKLGLVGTYANEEELTANVWQAIAYDIAQFELLSSTEPKGHDAGGGVKLLVQAGSERVAQTDSKGRIRNRLHRWVDVINNGTVDARDVRVEAIGEGVFLANADRPRTVNAGQSQRFPYELSIAASGHGRFRLTWDEDGVTQERDYDV